MENRWIRLAVGTVLVAVIAFVTLAALSTASPPLEAAGPLEPPLQTGGDSALTPMYSTKVYTYTTAGTTNWTTPLGTYQCNAETWGGGGKAANTSIGATGGGGGGAYSRKSNIPLIAGNIYTLVVGAGSNSSTYPGGDSYFFDQSTVLARGGNSSTSNIGATGGAASAGIGDVKYSGGNGATGGTAYYNGGGGGSSAGPGADGNNASGSTPGAAPVGGGPGGAGAFYGAGYNGGAPGGGGGGAAYYNSFVTGGNGANGQVVLTCREESIPPTGSILINNGASYANSTLVTLNLSATDATSGVYQMRFSNDNLGWTAWLTYGTTAGWTLTGGDGTKTVYVQYKDKAGNASTSFSDAIVLDTTAPTIISTTPANNACATLNGTVTINWSENIDCGTVLPWTVTISPGSWGSSFCSGNLATFTPNSQTAGAYTVSAGTGVKDLAGNAMSPYAFSYRIPGTYTSAGPGGNWDTAASWAQNAVPSATCDTVVIASGATVSVTANKTVAAGLTVQSGGTLALGAGMNFGPSLSTINGTLRINSGGYVDTYPPTYASGSLLQYATGGTFKHGLEWSATSGPGYPANVQVSNMTKVNSANGSIAAQSISGNLTIDADSNLVLGYDYPYPPVITPLTVAGDVTLFGGLTLGNAIGGDIYVGGNWTNNGYFAPQAKHTVFNGTAPQTIGGTNATRFDHVTINNPNGVTLTTDATVSQPLTLAAGRVYIGQHTLTVQSLGSGPYSTANMIVADGGGQVCGLYYSILPSRSFPIGDNTGTPEYSPVSVNITSGTFGSDARVCVKVTNAAHPNGDQANYPTYINRYWTVTPSGITGFTADVSFSYVPADVVVGSGQSESALGLWKYDAPSTWNVFGAANTTYRTLSASGITSFSDFTGRSISPLAVEMADFHADVVNGQAALTWETVSEQDNAGFNVYRGESEQGPWVKANEALIPSAAPGSSEGRVYQWTDPNPLSPGAPNGAQWYLLEDVDVHGAATPHGPVRVGLDAPTAVTIQAFSAQVDWGQLRWLGVLRALFGR